ncbi:MAG TPA: ABC transporter ATP-binding protein [Terriglobales bacterium]|nr:ABC transporter ATP-binding protein [Terriglobales bacterium]
MTTASNLSAAAISIRDLVKSFASKKALDGVSLDLHPNEVLGLLGPNGAGKSTLIRSIVGRVLPDSGSIHILGFAPRTKEARGHLGYVPQDLALYPTLSAAENLEVFGRYHGMSSKQLVDSTKWCLEWAALNDRARDKSNTFSGGMKRRLNMAAGLVHRPKIVLFDEPTVGVDPQSRERIYAMIEDLRSQGNSVIYTTHYMEEAERLCDRIAIIDHGRIIAQGTRAELIEHTFGAGKKLLVQFESAPTPAAAQWMNSIGATLKTTDDIHSAELAIAIPAKDIAAFLSSAASHGLNIRDLSLKTPSLESVFLQLTGRGLRE